MKRLNLLVPQWQDSGFTNEIFHGSLALHAMLSERMSFRAVEVAEDGELLLENGIYGYRVILEQLDRIRWVVEEESPDTLFTVGGGCGVEIPLVSHLARKHGPVRLFWFDAHGDINSPQSSPSGYFHGMPLRFLLESLPDNAISAQFPPPASHDDVVLIGTRDLDEPERAYIEQHSITLLPPVDCESDSTVLRAGGGDRATAYIHIDLDVLDADEFQNVKCPADGGLSIALVARMMELIGGSHRVVGVSLLENMETDYRRLATLQPIIESALAVLDGAEG